MKKFNYIIEAKEEIKKKEDLFINDNRKYSDNSNIFNNISINKESHEGLTNKYKSYRNISNSIKKFKNKFNSDLNSYSTHKIPNFILARIYEFVLNKKIIQLIGIYVAYSMTNNFLRRTFNSSLVEVSGIRFM